MRERHALVARAIHFGGLPAPAIDPVVWEQLLAAIHGREVVRVDYAALGEERAATRTLHPYKLLARDRDWFLVARHVRRRRELLYYLPRITSVRPRCASRPSTRPWRPSARGHAISAQRST